MSWIAVGFWVVAAAAPCAFTAGVPRFDVGVRMPDLTLARPAVLDVKLSPPPRGGVRGADCTTVVFRAHCCLPLVGYRTGFDPVQAEGLLMAAFRGAAGMELWRVERIQDEGALANGAAENFRYRDQLITGFTRSRQLQDMAAVFGRLLSAIAAAEPLDEFLVAAEPPRGDPEDFLSGMRFSPGLVVTFSGGAPLRIEVDFQWRAMLVRTRDTFELLTLNEADIGALQVLASSLALPEDVRVVPARAFEAL